MGFVFVVSVAVVVFLLTFGAGARWQYWWAMAVALYAVGILAG
jgi:hypothetical protein